jgi:IPT/TIG domain
MSDDFLDRFTILGEEPVGPDAGVDRGWVTRGVDANRVESSLDVMLTFVDSVRERTDITEAMLNGLVRAIFDERKPARELRAALTPGTEALTGNTFETEFGETEFGDPLGRRGVADLLDRRDLGDLLDRPALDELLDKLDPSGPLDPPIDVPDDLVPLDEFLQTGCVRDVMSGLAKLGGIVAAVPRARPKTGAAINSIEPHAAVVGQLLTIKGSGFGDPKATDVEVYIATQHAPHITWSDAEITVTVPSGVSGDVCVSVLENVVLDSSAAGDAVVMAVEVGSTMIGCFGISKVGERLASGTAALIAPKAECGPLNHIWVGAPAIDTFVINDSSTSARIRPGDVIELSWATRFADQVRLQAAVRSGVAPPAVLVPNAQVAGTDRRRLGPSTSRLVWDVDYILTATNAAGFRQRTVRATGTFGFAMAFLGAGTRSIFHAGALEYLPLACATAPRAVSSTGLGALGALSAATTWGNTAPLIASWNTINAAPIPAPPQFARAYYVMNSLIAEDATVRGAFDAYEQGMYTRLLAAVDVSVNEAMLSYADAPVIGDIPIAITDDETILENKVIEGLKDAGMWVTKNVIGPALEDGGVSDGDMGKVTAPAKAVVEEAIVGNAVQGGINGVGIALMNVNPVVAAAFVVVADVVKGLVEGAFDIGKANALRAALAARALCGRAPLVTLIDDFITRTGLQGRTVGTSTGVALGASMLESGEPAYVDGFAYARTASGGTIGSLGWRDALLAVTAVPGALAPVTAGAVNLVDAAYTDVGPLEILQRGDVDEIVVVHGTCNLLPRVQSPDNFSTVGFLTLARRGERVRSASLALTGIEPDRFWKEVINQQDPTRRRWKTRHVMPTIAMSNLYAFEHEPGLVSIWRDYGYMRAFDVMAPTLIHAGEDEASEDLRRELRDRLAVLSDLITGTRAAAWRLEHWINKVLPVESGPIDRRNPPEVSIVNDGSNLLALRQLKTLICDQVRRRLQMVQLAEKVYRSSVSKWPGDAVPRPRFSTWFTEFEAHGYTFDNILSIDPTGLGRVNPWLETIGFGVNDNVPSATPPSIAPSLFSPLP